MPASTVSPPLDVAAAVPVAVDVVADVPVAVEVAIGVAAPIDVAVDVSVVVAAAVPVADDVAVDVAVVNDVAVAAFPLTRGILHYRSSSSFAELCDICRLQQRLVVFPPLACGRRLPLGERLLI